MPTGLKSRFNPVSEEIADQLKKDEKVNMMQRKSPSEDTKNTASFMSKPYTPRPQAFSPLPSTSKDSETIMKNEKHFSESLRYNNYNSCDDEDDDELPDIQWESKNISEKKRPDSLLQSRDSELIFNEEPSVKSEDLNNNNNTSPAEIDLCEIQFEKYMPKKEYAVPELTNAATANDPIIIDEIDLDKVVENSEPKRVLRQIPEVIETLEIKDDYSSITYEDLYSVPKATEPVDVDELLKDLENYQQKQKKINSDIITIVDNADLKTSQSQKTHSNTIPKQASDANNLAVKMILPKEPSVTVAERANIVEPVDIIEIPDCVSGFPEPRNRLALQAPTNDVEFVSETVLENFTDNSSINSIDDDEELQSVMTRYFFGNLRHRHDTESHSESNDDPTPELHTLFRFLTDDHSSSSYSRPKSRRKKSKKSKGPPKESSSVNNENAAPSTNVQTDPPTNGNEDSESTVLYAWKTWHEDPLRQLRVGMCLFGLY
ncbi:uncharacterized protein [Choristoneura fumiferana]|uniref:uncharacterized protein n=1 Tax=Choristoneura fumiferana TaxID=7141 RepID=UPI003D159A13